MATIEQYKTVILVKVFVKWLSTWIGCMFCITMSSTKWDREGERNENKWRQPPSHRVGKLIRWMARIRTLIELKSFKYNFGDKLISWTRTTFISIFCHTFCEKFDSFSLVFLFFLFVFFSWFVFGSEQRMLMHWICIIKKLKLSIQRQAK